jgi:hypothetical protein
VKVKRYTIAPLKWVHAGDNVGSFSVAHTVLGAIAVITDDDGQVRWQHSFEDDQYGSSTACETLQEAFLKAEEFYVNWLLPALTETSE